MATANSTRAARREKPAKPRPDFPLSWHPAGYWAKKIRGKLHYFGPRWGTAQEAEEDYSRKRDDLHAGRTPRVDAEGTTVRLTCNAFLADRESRLQSGALSQRTFREYLKTCERMVAVLGESRPLGELRPEDFAKLRAWMVKRDWKPVTIGNEIQRVRTVLKFAYEADLIDRPIRTGPSFRKPSKEVLRLARAERGKRMLTAEQSDALLQAASVEMRAMILLALNAGLGNTDVARLELRHVDLQSGWLDYPRPKTGIKRRCKLWPETVAALQAVLEKRKAPKSRELEGRVFVTKYGADWSPKGGGCVVSAEFSKLLRALKIKTVGSFYTLRHVHATVAGGSRDHGACNAVVGHVDASMAVTCRETIDDKRLEAVAEYVRDWLFGRRNDG